MSWVELTRWLHLVTGAAWLGAVLVVVFVVEPALRRASAEGQADLLRHVLPRVFRLASVLVWLTLLTGGTLASHYFAADPSTLVEVPYRRALLVGAVLGGVVGTFHLAIEPRLERRIEASAGSPAEIVALQLRLHRIARVGLVVLTLVTLLMVAGARGWHL